LQRMKQYEVIILRMRKQPFKTKVTPNYKLDWGEKYPIAKYPTRQKKEVHTFDIKEFVKNEKKKKLLEMMNAADESDREKASIPFPFRPENEAAARLPIELQQIRERRNQEVPVPDFLTRELPKEKPVSPIPSPKEPITDDDEDFVSFADAPKSPSVPTNVRALDDEEDDDDDLGFDVDELVRKIDAKIAELEAEEKKNQEEEERKKKEEREKLPEVPEAPIVSNSIESLYEERKPVVSNPPVSSNLTLDDDGDDDDFFDDFFDN